MRFHAPPRGAVPAARFDHPVFAALQPWRAWLVDDAWPSVDTIASAFPDSAGKGTADPRPVAQTPELLADGLHYETRIFRTGAIATREGSWHDLFNALAWLAWSDLKAALNRRQALDVERFGPARRSRGQCAVTHMDEAGVVLVLREAGRVAAWDRHDWPGLFGGLTAADFAIAVVGHALHEHALEADRLLVGKALVALADDPAAALPSIVSDCAAAIADRRLLCDPQELRPLPLMGLPGWHAEAGERRFLAGAPCFQPVRAGRRYPAPFVDRQSVVAPSGAPAGGPGSMSVEIRGSRDRAERNGESRRTARRTPS